MRRKKILNILLHITIWSIYIVLPIFVIPLSSEYLLANDIRLTIYLTNSALLILFFYLNFNIFLPKLYFQKKYLWFVISIFSLLISFVLITRLVVSIIHPENLILERQNLLFRNYFSQFILIFVVSLLLSYRERYKRIEQEKTSAELDALKSQLNPHFLFNTLNDIYGLALTKSNKTADSISKLSFMMRYVLTQANSEKVPLQDEIKHLQTFVELQKIRITGKTKINFDVKGNITSRQIQPLLFINFVENAFKYGVSNEHETQINIQISLNGDVLHFSITNDKIIKNSRISNNIGLENIRKRLNLIYGDNSILKINETDNIFMVSLTINNL
jgi:two-component system LytT family sensor kinase